MTTIHLRNRISDVSEKITFFFLLCNFNHCGVVGFLFVCILIFAIYASAAFYIFWAQRAIGETGFLYLILTMWWVRYIQVFLIAVSNSLLSVSNCIQFPVHIFQINQLTNHRLENYVQTSGCLHNEQNSSYFIILWQDTKRNTARWKFILWIMSK